MFLEADHQVGPIVWGLGRGFCVAQQSRGAGDAPARAVEDLEAILQHQAGHVAPEAHAQGMDEKGGAGRPEGGQDPDELEDRRAALAEETSLAHVSGSTQPCRADEERVSLPELAPARSHLRVPLFSQRTAAGPTSRRSGYRGGPRRR